MRGMQDRVVLVTGAASGIGKATVTRLTVEGAVAIGVDVVGPNPVDVRDEDAVAALVDGVVAEHGRLDGVVTAAGVAGGGPAHLVDQVEWERVVGVNLTGTFLVAKHVARVMLDQERRG